MQSKIKKILVVFMLAVFLASFISITFIWVADASGPHTSPSDLKISAAGADSLETTAAQQAAAYEINDIVGATYDPTTGELIVIGQMLGGDLPTMSYEDVKNNLLVAMRAVHETAYPPSLGVPPLGPAVTIDPIPGDPEADHVVKFFGNITNTHYGYVFFESDRLLKTYTLGQDNLNPDVPFASSVPNYNSYFDRWLDLGDPDFTTPISVRWWFTPSLHLQIEAVNTQTIIFSNTQVILNRELTGDNITNNSRQAADDFVDHFNTNYHLFAAEQHALGNDALYELPQLYKLYGIACWTWAENNTALNVSGANGGWLGNYPILASSTPLTTPVISRTGVLGGGVVTIYGGVGTVPPVGNQVDPLAQQMRQALETQRSQLPKDTYIFPFYSAGDISPTDASQLIAMVFPLSANLLSNPSFEGGPGSAGWVQNPDDLIFAGAEHWGSYGVYLGGFSGADESIYQEVSIPASATNPRLSYYWVMFSDELQLLTSNTPIDVSASLPPFVVINSPEAVHRLPSAKQASVSSVSSVEHDLSPASANDFLYVQILDTNNNVLQTLQTISNEDTRSSWQISSFALDDYKGQTIRIRFRATNNATNHTSFYIDDISLDIGAGLGTGVVYLPIVMK